MEKKGFYQRLEKKLREDDRFIDGEGNLIKGEVINKAYQIDKKLIEMLGAVKEFKEFFFKKINDLYVFDTTRFVDSMEKNILGDSYTQFSQKIGLTISNKFMKQRGEVALVWPFKDCVLEGGMTEEDQKREEVFYNEILDKDEIDRLKEKKVLTNFKRFTKKGEEKVEDFKRDENGKIEENLIIKGNNLLALQTLKNKFKERIKLIYIDPPYNIGKGDFGYNDDFKHSTWLTFIKNRLEDAKTLLKETGAIIISCDDAEQAYLKILLDEIFERRNFLVNGVVNRASEIATNYIISKHEYYIIYAKEFNMFKLEGEQRYTISRGTVGNENQTMPIITFPEGLECINVKDGTYKETRKKEESKENVENFEPIIVENGMLKEKVNLKAKWRSSNDMRRFFSNDCKPTVAKINGIIEKIYFNGDRFIPQIKKRIVEKIPSMILDNKRGSKDLDKLELKGEFKYPKNVDYIKKLISYIVTDEEYVLDFFAGSGTTGQAIFELNELDGKDRKFILVEQLEKHMKTCIKRLKNVIKQKNNREFIYFDLLRYNQEATEKIEDAKNINEILIIWEEMCDKYFLNYDVEIKRFNENKKAFIELSLKEQKRKLVEMLDKNQLYVNLTEIDDSQFNVTKEDKELNKKFYESR